MSDVIYYTLIAFLVLIIPFALWVVLIRWLFRVNEIAGYLRRIADKLNPLAQCDYCHKEYLVSQLTRSENGKYVCPICKKKFS
jgi:formylmethanofuran dehydrogenase subunit E